MKQAGAGARRTAVVRLTVGCDPQLAADELVRAGAEIDTVGATAVVAKVSPGVIDAIEHEPWLSRVEAPQQLFPRRAGLRHR